MPKKKEEPDFKKVKQKVGKKKIDTKATDVTIRSKRIRIQEQSILRDEQEIVNSHNKSLGDLVSQFTHFNANTRKDAVLGLKDLFMENKILFTTSVSVLITKTIPLLLDTDVAVRQAVVNVFETLLPLIPQTVLLPFSSVVCVFVNNGLTSINPAIRKSALLMLQTLLTIQPAFFQDSTVKILSSLVKLSTEVNMTQTTNRGVLAANRTQMKANSSQQRPMSDLALETTQLFFEKCFPQCSIYREINRWSKFQENEVDESLILSKETRLAIPLTRSILSPSLFLTSNDNSSSTSTSSTSSTPTPSSTSSDVDPTLKTTLQTLMQFLRTATAELLPEEESTSSLGRHIGQAGGKPSFKSKSISEKNLQRLLRLQELAASIAILLHGDVGKSKIEWTKLLIEFYPLRLPDSQRNETALKLRLQQVNTLTIALLSRLNGKLNDQILAIVKDHFHHFQFHEKTGEESGKVVVLNVEILHCMCEQFKETPSMSEVITEAELKWNDLLEKNNGLLSMPFIQFFHYILEHHYASSFTGCLGHIVKCLQKVPYEKSERLWKMALRLTLGILKSIPAVEESFKESFSVVVKENASALPTDVISVVTAISSFCGGLPQLAGL